MEWKKITPETEFNMDYDYLIRFSPNTYYLLQSWENRCWEILPSEDILYPEQLKKWSLDGPNPCYLKLDEANQ